MKTQKSKVKGQNHRSKVKGGIGLVTEESGLKYGDGHEGSGHKGELKSRTYKFAVAVVKFVDSFEKNSVRSSVCDQLVRSATSISANIVEARSASSKRDFMRYYEIALKSSNETKFWLCLLRDAFDVDRSRVESLLGEATELSNMIAASVLTMKKKR